MLSNHTIAIVKSTIPLLADAGTAVTEHFYNRMFTHNPELKDIFNMSNQVSGKQQFALFNALAAYATHIDNLDVLKQAIARINHKHASLNILPHHYDIVGLHLIATLKELAPEAFTSEVEKAWIEAYALLSDVFITQEEGIYRTTEESLGGWRNTRSFTIKNIVQESAFVKSFYLQPTDGNSISSYLPGQYIAVHVKPNNCDNIQIRQYSLSQNANPNHYRISVKQEGVVSQYLHQLEIGNTIHLSPPAGDFVLQETPSPKVLISAGVGITPMMSMLESLSKSEQPFPIHFIHACASAQEHSFESRVTALESELPQLTTHFWHEKGQTPYNRGRIDLSTLALPIATGEFYLCGPSGFMAAMKQQLIALKVPEAQIFYEVFGPHETL